MKRWMIAFIIGLVCLPLAGAADIGVYGSHWSPEDADDAWGGGVSVLFDFIPMEIRGTYYDVNVDGDRTLDAIPIDAGLAVDVTRSNKLDVYLGIGGSYYFLDSERGDVDNEFGWYAMARLEVPVESSFNVFGEVMHRGVESDELDADLSGTVFSVGIVFR